MVESKKIYEARRVPARIPAQRFTFNFTPRFKFYFMLFD